MLNQKRLVREVLKLVENWDRLVSATLGLPIVTGLIAVALLFDFLNGPHDAANSIATIVFTRVLRPHYAVFWASFFNFVAFLVLGLDVAQSAPASSTLRSSMHRSSSPP